MLLLQRQQGFLRLKNCRPHPSLPSLRSPALSLRPPSPPCRARRELRDFKPDLIHVSSPGVMTLSARLWAFVLAVPLVMSYHTHMPKFLPKYGLSMFVPAFWALLRALHAGAQLTLATSDAIAAELAAQRVGGDGDPSRLQVWRKGVDADAFHPRFRDGAMRARLAGGDAAAAAAPGTLLLYVGRLGQEKNLTFLRDVLDRCPGTRLALVGDGPARPDLEAHFAGALGLGCALSFFVECGGEGGRASSMRGFGLRPAAGCPRALAA